MVEADFQREYQIDLLLEIDTITWRRFCILLNGLSGDSLYIIMGQKRDEGEVAIDASDPATADRIMNSFF